MVFAFRKHGAQEYGSARSDMADGKLAARAIRCGSAPGLDGCVRVSTGVALPFYIVTSFACGRGPDVSTFGHSLSDDRPGVGRTSGFPPPAAGRRKCLPEAS